MPYSDIEKTYLDMVYFKENISKDTLKEIFKRMDSGKIANYLRDYPRRFEERLYKE